MRNLVTVTLFLFIWFFLPVQEGLTGHNHSHHIRGLWVIRHNLTTAESIDSLLARASRLGFTDLFVQVRGRGDAYYSSHYEPPGEGLDGSFDPLGYLLQQAKPYSFRIHAWVNIFYVWSKNDQPRSRQHLLKHNPDWIAYPFFVNTPYLNKDSYTGNHNGEGFYNSPLLPKVQKHILKVVDDILSQYSVDGLHLDYIRYPGPDFDFHPQIRYLFKRRYALDPLEFKRSPEQFIKVYGRTGYELYYTKWVRFLRDGLSLFVKKLSIHIHSRYPGVIVSAAVKPDLARAHWEYFQDWDRWVREGWLDWAIPMNYAAHTNLFLSRIRDYLQEVDPGRCVIGVAIYNQSLTSAIARLQMLKEFPFAGFVLFSYDQFKPDARLRSLYRKSILNIEE